MKTRMLGVTLCAMMAASLTAAAAEVVPPTEKATEVQLALLLDTSNSMDGLIEQAKAQLWRIVNEFAEAARKGKKLNIQVALYQYGTPSLGAETGYIKQLVPLSGDLDKVSEELFRLKTNGGDEYCGTVIKTATDQLKWGTDKNGYRAIFIAGNEPFTQGKVDFNVSCKEAIAKGIVVNTIFCGQHAEGVNTKWKAGADLSDGAYFSINQNERVVDVATPFDKDLAELSGKINSTYLAYGRKGVEGAARQTAQDANAATVAPASVAARAATKASALYNNAAWDLVDAVGQKEVKLEAMKEEELPAELQKLPVDERKTYVENKQKERAAIQEQITKLSKDRDAFVAAEKKKQAAGAGTNTLDAAIISAIRTQAGKNGFQF